MDILFPGVHWVVEIIGVVTVILFLGICVCLRFIRYFWKFPAPALVGNLIAAGPYRKRVQPPSMIVEAIGCRPGMVIIEIGCGSGLFTVAVAKAIAPDGVVYAVDIQEGMLEKLRRRLIHENVENVVPILADAEGLIPLDDGVADAVFSVAVIPEIPAPVRALTQVRRLMKDGGVFADSELIIDPDYPRQRTVVNWAREAGLILERRSGNAFRYVLVFRKQKA